MIDPTRLSGPSRVPLPTRPRPLRSLAYRLVLLGVLQLALCLLIAGVVWLTAGPIDEAHPHEYLDRPAITKLEGLVHDRPALEAALARLHDDLIEVSIYDANRRLVISNTEPALAIPDGAPGPPAPPGEHPAGPPPHGDGPGGPPRDGPPRGDSGAGPPADWPGPQFDDPPSKREPGPGKGRGTPHALMMHFTIDGRPGYLIARGVFGRPAAPWLPATIVVASLLVLAATGFLTARWIARPIDRLRRTARAIGGGDLTARSRLQRMDEIGELGQQIDDMAERLSRLIAAERELLANVAHELRTPLSRIGMALDLAADGDGAAAREALAEISVDVGELETITDDIFMAMRFEVAGEAQLPLRKAATAPSSIAAGAVDRFRLRHPERPLDVRIADELPDLDVDAMLVRRVIDNLLENAHKYTPDRSLALELEVAGEDGCVRFAVKDRGIGISDEDLPHVFTPFFRSDRSRSRETGGVGLGLTLAKRILDAHGGGILVAARPGGGTIATVKLPLQR